MTLEEFNCDFYEKIENSDEKFNFLRTIVLTILDFSVENKQVDILVRHSIRVSKDINDGKHLVDN